MNEYAENYQRIFEQCIPMQTENDTHTLTHALAHTCVLGCMKDNERHVVSSLSRAMLQWEAVAA